MCFFTNWIAKRHWTCQFSARKICCQFTHIYDLPAGLFHGIFYEKKNKFVVMFEKITLLIISSILFSIRNHQQMVYHFVYVFDFIILMEEKVIKSWWRKEQKQLFRKINLRLFISNSNISSRIFFIEIELFYAAEEFR